MKLYRFSPIMSEDGLREAIRYTHRACHKLCKESVGEYLPVSGNVGIFCHDYDEYEYLTNLRKELTDETPNYNGKYFPLKYPITIEADGDVPAATYSYLYIRKVDPYRSQVGDVDFVMPPTEQAAMKRGLTVGDFRKGARLFERLDENMIELWKPAYDVASYIVTEPMSQKVK